MAKVDGDAVKAFFINHGEKIGVGVVAATAMMLLYTGFSKPSFKESQTPEALQQIAGRAKSALDQPHWDAIAAEREFPNDFANKAEQVQRPIQPKLYEIIPLKPVKEKNNILRHDPEIYPPEKVRAVGVLGALSVMSTTPNPIEALEAAEAIKAPEQKNSRKKNSRAAMNQMDLSMGMGMGSEYSGESSMSMDSSMGMISAGRLLAPKYYEGFRAASSASGMMAEQMMSGMSSSPSGVATATGPKEALTSQTGWFIAGSALVPEKRLIEEYERAFKDAQGYDPKRDAPWILNLVIRRADITGKTIDSLQDKDWMIIHDFRTLEMLTKKWEKPVPDPVPVEFRHPKLTFPLPPLLMQDYSSIASHPDLPKTFVGIKVIEPEAVKTEDTGVLDPTAGPTADLLQGSASPYGNNPYGMGESYDPSMSGESYEGDYGSGAMAMGPNTVIVLPEYKLIRFYDFFSPNNPRSIRPGRKYVYQVQFQVLDSNFPYPESLDPIPRHLMPDVLVRVDKLKAKQRESKKGRDVQQWFRSSDWSEPSNPAELPMPNDFYAGPVTPANISPVGPNRIDVERGPPSGKAMALRWSYEYATHIPAAVDVTRGSVINTSTSAEIVDLLSKQIKVLPPEKGGAIRTGATVIDFAGGQPLAHDPKDEKMVSPGMVLMFDPSGGLKVLDEIDSSWEFRKHTFADEHEAAVAPAAAPMMMMDESMGMGFGG